MNLTIIIPFYNGHKFLSKLVPTLPNNIPVLFVDDLSETPLTHDDFPSHDKKISILRLQEKGYFAGGVNTGIRHCDTDVLVINQDVWFEGMGWLDLINAYRDEYAMIGERIKGDREDWANAYIHGTFMFMRRDAIEKVGYLNQLVFPLWGGTAEWQLRLCRQGFKAKPVADIPDFHHRRPEKQPWGSSIRNLLKEEWNHSKNRTRFLRVPPEISVVIPCHNFSKWLPDAINSLIGGPTSLGNMTGQTFQGFEVVIVDDSSTDDTPEVVRNLVGDGWKGIRSIRLDRGNVQDEDGRYTGKPVALNEGIKNAYGKYITVLDADDMMEPERLERLWRKAESHPHSIIYDDLKTFANGTRTKTWEMGEYHFDTLIQKNQMHIGIFYPKEAWQEIGGYAEEMKWGREDWAINVAFGLHGWCGIRIPYAGYLYRREGQNRTLENTTPTWRNRFKAQLGELFSDLYKRGVTPMACCGRGATKRPNSRLDARKKNVLSNAVDGTTLLDYQGSRVGSFTEWGPVSGRPYRVKPGIPFAVENGDLPRMLNLYEAGGKPKYGKTKIVKAPQEPVQKEAESVQISPVLTATEVTPTTTSVEEETATEGEFEAIDYESILETITSLKKALRDNTYTDAELQALLDYEKLHKDRIGAKDALREELGIT